MTAIMSDWPWWMFGVLTLGLIALIGISALLGFWLGGRK